jgi:hypothetical protein
MSDLVAVETPDHSATLKRLLVARRSAQAAADAVLVGILVRDFTNDELRAVADEMSIAETMTLRRLGLLAPDEGYDGRRKS